MVEWIANNPAFFLSGGVLNFVINAACFNYLRILFKERREAHARMEALEARLDKHFDWKEREADA